jgi:hypothetical protein
MRRLRTLLAFAIVAAMMTVFFYGLWRFPDAPIHPCAKYGYCGKQGQPHSRRDFDAFNHWETTLLWLWPLGMLTAYLLQRKPLGSGYADARATYEVDKAHPDDMASNNRWRGP